MNLWSLEMVLADNLISHYYMKLDRWCSLNKKYSNKSKDLSLFTLTRNLISVLFAVIYTLLRLFCPLLPINPSRAICFAVLKQLLFVASRKILQAFSKLINYLASSSICVFGLVNSGDLWPLMHCWFRLIYSRCYHLCSALHTHTHTPHPSSLSMDKSSVSGPIGLEKLLTVGCLFGFVSVSALEKGWTEE